MAGGNDNNYGYQSVADVILHLAQNIEHNIGAGFNDTARVVAKQLVQELKELKHQGYTYQAPEFATVTIGRISQLSHALNDIAAKVDRAEQEGRQISPKEIKADIENAHIGWEFLQSHKQGISR